jgi:hypothetical protein
VDSNRIKPHARIRITLPLATQQPTSCCPATLVALTTPNFSGGESGDGANDGGSICFSADLYRINKIVLLHKEYEEEMREAEQLPAGLPHPYSNMTAW